MGKQDGPLRREQPTWRWCRSSVRVGQPEAQSHLYPQLLSSVPATVHSEREPLCSFRTEGIQYRKEVAQVNEDLRCAPEISSKKAGGTWGRGSASRVQDLKPLDRNGTHSQTCPTGPEAWRKGRATETGHRQRRCLKQGAGEMPRVLPSSCLPVLPIGQTTRKPEGKGAWEM